MNRAARRAARSGGITRPVKQARAGGGAYVTRTSPNKGRVQLVGSCPSAAGQRTAVAAVKATLGGNTLTITTYVLCSLWMAQPRRHDSDLIMVRPGRVSGRR